MLFFIDVVKKVIAEGKPLRWAGEEKAIVLLKEKNKKNILHFYFHFFPSAEVLQGCVLMFKSVFLGNYLPASRCNEVERKRVSRGGEAMGKSRF